MLKRSQILFCFVACFSLQAGFDFDAMLDRFSGGQISFLAISAKTHEVLAEHNSNLLLNPASNVKLVTTLAALEILHPEYRFKTEYYATGPIRAGVLEGNLLVKGYGDPSLTNERLQKTARHLKLLGIESITGALILDDSYFGGENIPPGWEKDGISQKLYTSFPAALSLNQNTIVLFIRPTETGKAAIILSDPPVDYWRFTGLIKTIPKRVKSTYTVRKKVLNPNAYFESVFSYFLKQEGILIHGGVVNGRETKLLLTDKSPILSQIIAETNKSSSNFMAEMLVKAIAAKVQTPAKFERGLLEISKFLENKVGFRKASFTLVNGSGLGLKNRFSARQFVQLLEYAQKNFELSSEFMASLGVAGTQGTLSKRMKQEPTLRSLRAKTGSLAGVSSLSGYVDTQGDDAMIFSILVQGKPKAIAKARWLEDRIGNSLARLHTDSAPLMAAEESEEAENEELEELSGG